MATSPWAEGAFGESVTENTKCHFTSASPQERRSGDDAAHSEISHISWRHVGTIPETLRQLYGQILVFQIFKDSYII